MGVSNILPFHSFSAPSCLLAKLADELPHFGNSAWEYQITVVRLALGDLAGGGAGHESLFLNMRFPTSNILVYNKSKNRR
jgi:hypothetical protein